MFDTQCCHYAFTTAAGSPLGTPSPAETETGPGAAPTAAPEATEPVELSPTLEPVTATLEPLAATPKPAVTSEPESAPTEPLPPPVSAEGMLRWAGFGALHIFLGLKV